LLLASLAEPLPFYGSGRVTRREDGEGEQRSDLRSSFVMPNVVRPESSSACHRSNGGGVGTGCWLVCACAVKFNEFSSQSLVVQYITLLSTADAELMRWINGLQSAYGN